MRMKNHEKEPRNPLTVFKSINIELASSGFYNPIEDIQSFKAKSLFGEIWGQGRRGDRSGGE